jgi:hypothetical protein
MFGPLNFLQNPDDSSVIADKEDVSRPVCKDALANNAGHMIDDRFKLQRVGNLQPVNIEDNVSVICHRTLSPNRVTSKAIKRISN